jgi:hypothetical protein
LLPMTSLLTPNLLFALKTMDQFYSPHAQYL